MVKKGVLTITRPVAQVNSSKLTQVLYKLSAKDKCKELKDVIWYEFEAPKLMYSVSNLYRMELHLHKHLRLNLTIIKLYIPESVYLEGHKCTRGLIRVQSTNKAKTIEWDLCGLLSYTTLYPAFSHITVFSMARAFVFINASLQFVVMDHNTLESEVVDGQSIVSPRWSFHFPATKVELVYYNLVASKIKCLEIFMNRSAVDSVVVYDGPGIKSHILESSTSDPDMVYYISSAFHVVFYCATHEHLTKHMNTRFRTKVNQKIHISSVSVSQEKQTFDFPHPDLCFHQHLCIVDFVSESRDSLNITLSGMLYEGDANTEGCEYAAVLAYSSGYEDYDAVCVRQYEECSFRRDCYRDSKHQHHIYLFDMDCDSYIHPQASDTTALRTQSHTITVVLYSFPEYGTLSTTVQVSTTPCTVHVVDFCEGRNFLLDSYKLWYSLENLWRIGSTQVALKWRVGCIVFQFRSRVFAREKRFVCKIKLGTFANQMQRGGMFSTHISGHIVGLSSFGPFLC